MKKAILILSFIVFISADTDPCSNFDSTVSTYCRALTTATTKCTYSGNQCVQDYYECNEYAPTSGFEDAKCKGIIPSDHLYMCEVKTEGGNKSCQQRLKKCSEHTSNDICVELQAGDGQRCLLIENTRCEAHYNDCSSLTSLGKAKCEANIPNDKSKICSWSSDACSTTDRYCEKYLQYQGPESEISEYCTSLKAEESKVCLFEDGKTCHQVYENCEKGNNNENICKTIRPLNTDKTDYDHLNKCKYNSPNCETQQKYCEDYEKGFDNGMVCSQLISHDINKMCSYDASKDECKETYITCESYNSVETNADNRDKTICQAIFPRNSETKQVDLNSICDLNDDKECIKLPKPCNKITDESICNYQILDGDKKCLFVNNQCKEVYQTCSIYTNKVEASKRNKNDCEAIEYTDIYKYKCVYDSSNNLNKCEPEKIKCEDYKGQSETYCDSLSTNIDPSETNDYKCKFIDGKCIKQFKTCENYGEKDKKICESIKPYSSYNKCVLKNDKTCTTEQKTCSEYSGKIESECSSYKASTDKKCGIVNGKCTEKSIFNYCSDYRGNNKEECESIQPYYENNNLVDPSSKCVYSTEGCIRQAKKCTEASTESECPKIIPSDTDKQCTFINSKCVEQYKTCELYNTKEEATKFTKDGCESILINELGFPSTTYKCKYTAPTTTGAKGTCTREARSCSDFKAEIIQSDCTSINPGFTKKCVFNPSNNSCSSKEKTCLELSHVTGANNNLDAACNNAATSSPDKMCKKKEDESGC